MVTAPLLRSTFASRAYTRCSGLGFELRKMIHCHPYFLGSIFSFTGENFRFESEAAIQEVGLSNVGLQVAADDMWAMHLRSRRWNRLCRRCRHFDLRQAALVTGNNGGPLDDDHQRHYPCAEGTQLRPVRPRDVLIRFDRSGAQCGRASSADFGLRTCRPQPIVARHRLIFYKGDIDCAVF